MPNVDSSSQQQAGQDHERPCSGKGVVHCVCFAAAHAYSCNASFLLSIAYAKHRQQPSAASWLCLAMQRAVPPRSGARGGVAQQQAAVENAVLQCVCFVSLFCLLVVLLLSGGRAATYLLKQC